jgi:hypothetical protein
MIDRGVAALLALVAVGACGPVHSTVRPDAGHLTHISAVAVLVVEDGGFTVIKERAKATATAAAFFGLVGAAVSAAANHSMDSGEADRARPGLAGFSATQVLRDAFVDTLKSSGRLRVDVADSEAALQALKGHDAVVRLTLKDWGVRLPARAISDDLAPFAEIHARMTRAEAVLWDEHDVALGRARHALTQYQADGALLRAQLTETLHEAGYRLANHVLYPRETPR